MISRRVALPARATRPHYPAVALTAALSALQIQKEYVLEAYRLLQKSVIHVDTDDVVLDVDMPEPDRRAFVPVAAGAEEAEGEEAAEEEMAGEPVAAAKRPRQISFEEYQRVANSIVLYLRQHETEDSQGAWPVSRPCPQPPSRAAAQACAKATWCPGTLSNRLHARRRRRASCVRL